MKAADPGLQLCRVLIPPKRWLEGTHDARVEDFHGPDDEDISTYNTDQCSALTVLAAYYGNRGGHAPAPGVDPHHLSFTEAEVVAAGGKLDNTDATDPWPPEYNAAHRDILGDHAAVAEAIVSLCEEDAESRVRKTTRTEVVREIFKLADRPDAPDPFRRRVCKRAAKLLRDEAEIYLELAGKFHDLCWLFLDTDKNHQGTMREYWRHDREFWEKVVACVPEAGRDKRFSTGG